MEFRLKQPSPSKETSADFHSFNTVSFSSSTLSQYMVTFRNPVDGSPISDVIFSLLLFIMRCCSPLQEANACSPIVSKFGPNSISSSSWQFSKALPPIDVIPSGSFMLFNDLQFSNAYGFISVRLSGSLTSTSALQSENV